MTISTRRNADFNTAYTSSNPNSVQIDQRKRAVMMTKSAVQQRLKAIIDAPVTISVIGVDGKSEQMTLPALEAMTQKLVEMVLAKGEFATIRDKDRINAYRVVHDRVLGAPKQVIEMIQNEVTEEDLSELTPDELKRLEVAHESILTTPIRKHL